MIKIIRPLLTFLLLFVLEAGSSAQAQNQPRIDKFLHDIGYTPVGEALASCEKLFQQKIQLPTRMPAITFTHQVGRCYHSSKADGMNDEFEITYLHEDDGKNHYSIRVRPIKFRIEIPQHRIEHTYTLQDTTKAVLFRASDASPLDTLSFEKNGWQYMLLLDNRSIEKTADTLLKIADTIK